MLILLAGGNFPGPTFKYRNMAPGDAEYINFPFALRLNNNYKDTLAVAEFHYKGTTIVFMFESGFSADKTAT